MRRYTIVKRGATESLEADVNALIDQGYEPLGGVAFNGGFHCQAMLAPAVAAVETAAEVKPAAGKKAVKRG